MYEDYYSEPDEYRSSKHSGFGIASFVITLAAGTLEFVLIVIVGILETTTPGGIDENSRIAMLLGVALIGGLIIDLFGIIFGLVGLFERGRRKPFAVLGVIIGSLVLVGSLFVVIIGLAMEG